MKYNIMTIVAVAAIIVGSGSEAKGAITIYDNGDGGGDSFWCNCESPGCGYYKIFDDFNLVAGNVVSGFTFDSYFEQSVSNYTQTRWAIWSVNPYTDFATGPLISGNSAGTVTDLGSRLGRIVIDGLSVALNAGTYWLETQNHSLLNNDGTSFAASTTGGGDLAIQASSVSPIADNRPESAFSIQAVPEPASSALLAFGGLGLMLRRRR